MVNAKSVVIVQEKFYEEGTRKENYSMTPENPLSPPLIILSSSIGAQSTFIRC